MDIYDKLIAPFPANEIEWRVQQCGIKNDKPWAMVLAYVQARAIQKRLDEIFGWDGWTDEYRPVEGNMICKLSVKLSNGEWMSKENGASETHVEAFKGGISSAFKRVAASGYGIGRYLYDLEEVFAECRFDKKQGWNKASFKDKQESAKQKKDIYKTIYWETPTLPNWALPNTKQDNGNKQPRKSSIKQQSKPEKHTCIDCKKEITDKVQNYSIEKYGKPLCMDCQSKAKKVS